MSELLRREYPGNIAFTRIFVLALFLLFYNNSLEAQRFSAALTVGGNASQIDGDDLAGYDKLGLNAGLRGTAELSDRWDLSIELLFSQRGSRTPNSNSAAQLRREINLDYVEIPVLISIKDWLVDHEKGEYYRVRAFAGLSYARLVNATVYDDDSATGYNDELADALNRNDISGIVGLSYTAYRNWEFSARYTRSFTRIYDTSEGNPLIPLSLVGYYISFNIAYLIK